MDDIERAARRERMRAAMGPETTSTSAMTKKDAENDKASNGGLKKGCLWIVGAFFGLAVLGAIFGEPPEDADVGQVQGGQVETAGPVDEAIIKSWYDSVFKTAKPCDTASAAMGDTLQAFANGRGSTLAVYQAASRAEDACRSTSLAFRRLDVPDGLPSAVEAAIEEAHETCSNGFVLKQMAAEMAAEVFDGAMSNSNITRLQELTKDGQNGVLACVGSTMKAVGEAGITSETLASWSE